MGQKSSPAFCGEEPAHYAAEGGCDFCRPSLLSRLTKTIARSEVSGTEFFWCEMVENSHDLPRNLKKRLAQTG